MPQHLLLLLLSLPLFSLLPLLPLLPMLLFSLLALMLLLSLPPVLLPLLPLLLRLDLDRQRLLHGRSSTCLSSCQIDIVPTRPGSMLSLSVPLYQVSLSRKNR
jgi:hypothetical protein